LTHINNNNNNKNNKDAEDEEDAEKKLIVQKLSNLHKQLLLNKWKPRAAGMNNKKN
jgi:hypothetical protein